MNAAITLLIAIAVIILHVWLCRRSPKFWYLGGIIPLLWTRDPARWQVHATLLSAILEHAKAAKRVFLRADADPMNEKYRANSFLMRLGFGGPEHKPLRRVLLGHLNGYAAFRSAAGMQAHREKYAQLRRKQREEARP